MRPLFLVKRWEHHSPAGGYDQLAARYPGAVSIRRAVVDSQTAKLGRRLWYSTFDSWHSVVDYQYGDYLAERRALWTSLRGRADLVHALYGDEHLDFLLRRRRWLRAGLVATFHLPTDTVRERWEQLQSHLAGGIDAAVVVSRSQLADYRRWLGAERVVYIPHGIDTERFCPDENTHADGRADGPLRLLTVGQNFRDFDAIHRLADHCAFRGLSVEFDAVIPTEAASALVGCDNVRMHTGIPEERLIDLYRQADALLLPVTSATANNAVLESIACGTPVITNDVGGMADYLDAASGWLLAPGDQWALTELVEAMLRDRTVATAKREGARNRAKEFCWETVVEQTRAVHEAVVGGRPPVGAVPS